MLNRWAAAVVIVLGLGVADASAQGTNFRVLAGASPAGIEDGTGGNARFNVPTGIAVNSAGTLYVADSWNNDLRAVTPAGTVSTFAGEAQSFGSTDGSGSAARFSVPQGAAVDGAGNVYVADTFNQTIRKITPAGLVTTLAGSPGHSGSTDATGSAARFNNPRGVAVDLAGNVYVADTNSHTIRMISPVGVVTTLAGQAGSSGNADGTGSAARFNNPQGVAVDPAGNVYVADPFNHVIRKIAAGGVVTTLAGLAGSNGFTDATGSAARFYQPRGVAVNTAGTILYVADSFNNRIRQITLPGGVVTTLAGAGTNGGDDGSVASARFSAPQGVAVDGAGVVYVADSNSDTIRKIAGGSVTTLAGFYGSLGAVDGAAESARFAGPNDAAVDAGGNIYVADRSNHTIRKISPAGNVTTLAGLAGTPGSADGTGSAARFNHPQGVAVDAAGTVYVADTDNTTVRTITPGGVVTTLAGLAGSPGSTNGTGSAARFSGLGKLAVDSSGNVYVSDSFNQTIRKILPGGIVTTLAGLAGSIGNTDGTGSAARFNNPRGVAVNAAGTVFVTDSNSNTIRQITPAGVVTTLAGLAGQFGSSDGTGSAARFGGPSAIAVDHTGTLYVADSSNSNIRKVTAAGVVTTIAGDCAGCIGSANTGRFNTPFGIAVNARGDLFVADTGNNTIQTTAGFKSSVVLDFGPGYGLWIRVGTAWRQVNPLTAEGILKISDRSQDGLIIDFGPGVGVWFWERDSSGTDSWFQLTPNNPTEMVALDVDGDGSSDYVAFNFPGQGVWVFGGDNQDWFQLHPLDASHLAAADLDGDSSDDLILDFPGAGLWVYYTGTSTWAQLIVRDASALLTADVDGNGSKDLVANFTAFGVWSYRTGTGWSQINPLDAARLTSGDLDGNGRTDIVFDFGTGVGLWVLQNGTTWWQLTPLTSEGIKTGDLDGNGHDEVIVDLGASGVWSYEDLAGWQQVAPLNPTAIVTGRFH